MAIALLGSLRKRLSGARDAGLWLRGVLFLGSRYRCPCCNWPLRAFTVRGGIWRTTGDGYCPRCNAKARHRRQVLYLQQHPEWFATPLRLLEIAPWRALARWLNAQATINYIGLDRQPAGPQVNLLGDASAVPLQSGCCDMVICIHVLEHVADDKAAIADLHRVLRPGGRAVVSVPLQFDGPTREDPAITDPAERQRLYGEPEHVRFYGVDLGDRLRAAGFDVKLELASELADTTCRIHGVRRDENIFCCLKPAETSN